MKIVSATVLCEFYLLAQNKAIELTRNLLIGQKSFPFAQLRGIKQISLGNVLIKYDEMKNFNKSLAGSVKI